MTAHLERACDLLWQAGHPAIAEALQGEVEALREALKEEMTWDMGGRLPERAVWRVGGKLRRTIYAQFGSDPSDNDPLIGVMDTPVLALACVTAHNELLTLGAA